MVAPWLVVALAGCYSYVPVRASELAPGTPVRVWISAEHAERLAPILGRRDRELTGTLAGRGGDGALTLSVPVAVSHAGLSRQWFRQRIEIPPPALVDVEVRRLDRWKTGGVVAAALAAVGYLVVEAFSGHTETDPGESPKGGVDRVVVPLRR